MISRHPVRTIGLMAVLTGMLLLGGCQSHGGSRSGLVDLETAMPGVIARTRYAHVVAAASSLTRALSDAQPRLDGVPLATTLQAQLSPEAFPDGQTPVVGLRKLIERDFFKSGPYHLVDVETISGRLEYRSEATGEHVSVTVRAPGTQEHQQHYVVVDMFCQMSLMTLAAALPYERAGAESSGVFRVQAHALTAGGNLISRDEISVLAYFNSLPPVERDREDLLGIRAMLMIRLGNDKRARPLVEQGIVRFPESPLYFNLASVLFERAGSSANNLPESLSTILKQRFTEREISGSRKSIDYFLDSHEVI